MAEWNAGEWKEASSSSTALQISKTQNVKYQYTIFKYQNNFMNIIRVTVSVLTFLNKFRLSKVFNLKNIQIRSDDIYRQNCILFPRRS